MAPSNVSGGGSSFNPFFNLKGVQQTNGLKTGKRNDTFFLDKNSSLELAAGRGQDSFVYSANSLGAKSTILRGGPGRDTLAVPDATVRQALAKLKADGYSFEFSDESFALVAANGEKVVLEGVENLRFSDANIDLTDPKQLRRFFLGLFDNGVPFTFSPDGLKPTAPFEDRPVSYIDRPSEEPVSSGFDYPFASSASSYNNPFTGGSGANNYARASSYASSLASDGGSALSSAFSSASSSSSSDYGSDYDSGSLGNQGSATQGFERLFPDGFLGAGDSDYLLNSLPANIQRSLTGSSFSGQLEKIVIQGPISIYFGEEG